MNFGKGFSNTKKLQKYDGDQRHRLCATGLAAANDNLLVKRHLFFGSGCVCCAIDSVCYFFSICASCNKSL